MRCQAERQTQFDLKFNPATQLLNGVPGSEYSPNDL